MSKRTYEFEGSEKNLDTLEDVFRHIEYLGNVGSSRNLLIRIDGDGCGQIRVLKNNKKVNDKKYNTKQNLGQGALVGIYDIG